MKNIYCYILQPVYPNNTYKCISEAYNSILGDSWSTRDGLLWKTLFDCGVGFLYNGYSHLFVMNNDEAYRVRRMKCNSIQQVEFSQHYKYNGELMSASKQKKLKKMILNYLQYKYAISGITIDNIKFVINPAGI